MWPEAGDLPDEDDLKMIKSDLRSKSADCLDDCKLRKKREGGT